MAAKPMKLTTKPKPGEKYKAFFKRLMKDAGIDNITDLKPDEKDDFFAYVDYAWTKEDESNESYTKLRGLIRNIVMEEIKK